jgi:conjugal transfer/type IV secretion protein DotA/TraY
MKRRFRFSRRWIIALATFQLAVSSIGIAHAGNFWTPQNGWNQDTSVKFLAFVFGDVVNSIASPGQSGGGTTILAALLQTMNAGVLVLAALAMGYNFIGGAVATAKDGEWLGRKWDTTWVPLRTAGGIAMLLPTTSGYSFIQVVMIWCGLQGVGLASSMWQTAQSYLSSETLISRPYIATNKTAEQVFLMAACKAGGASFGWNVTAVNGGGFVSYTVPNELTMTTAGACGTISWGNPNPGWLAGLTNTQSAINSAYATAYNLANGPNGSAANSSIIPTNGSIFNSFFAPQGSLSGAQIQTGVGTQAFSSINVEGPDSLYVLNTDDLAQFENDVRVAHGKIIQNMLDGVDSNTSGNQAFSQMGALVKSVVNPTDAIKSSIMPGTANTSYSVIGAAQAEYEAELSAAIVAAVQNDIFHTGSVDTNSTPGTASAWVNAMVAKMASGGWINAGSFYMKIGHLNNAIQREINNVVTTVYTVPDLEKMANPEQNSTFAAYLIMVKESLRGSHELSKTVDNSTGSESRIEAIWQRVKGSFTEAFLNFSLVGKLGASGMDPLVQMKNIGDTILVTAETAMVLSSDTMASALGGGNDSGKKEGSQTIATIVSLVVMLMLTMGIFLSIVLPMVPYIQWVGGVVEWFISFVTAVIATPLWAIGHMHPEGHDLAGKGSPGYMFTLFLVTKPALMIIFLFAAMLLIKPIMMFINAGFFEAISNMTEGSMAGIATLLGTTMVYSYISTDKIYQVFGMVNTGPEHVYQWVGGHDSVGTRANQHAQQTIGSVQGVGAPRVAQAIGKVLGGKKGSVVASAK